MYCDCYYCQLRQNPDDHYSQLYRQARAGDKAAFLELLKLAFRINRSFSEDTQVPNSAQEDVKELLHIAVDNDFPQRIIDVIANAYWWAHWIKPGFPPAVNQDGEMGIARLLSGEFDANFLD